MELIPFQPGRWSFGGAEPAPAVYGNRACIELADTLATVEGLALQDGAIEVDLAVGPERGFYGLVWRLQDARTYESFFVRPHQVGNPDSIQYTPVFNDVPAWQLYHGDGFWAPVAFPIGRWFRLRAAFAGRRAELYVGDLETPVLVTSELRLDPVPGSVGLLVSGPSIHVADFRIGDPELRAEAPPPTPAVAGRIEAWAVSDPFPERELGEAPPLEGRTWTLLDAEPSGLANLARVNGIEGARNTVLARATIRAERAEVRAVELGFSDRALVYLNGRRLYRGDDGYRSRDYRFLGSIGWYDTLYLPLEKGDNDLVVAVSEDFGGWGVQARFAG